ncbi:MAG: endonuclease/exonuclease/phosphatase family protein [Pseudomonadota bacterium]
MAARWISALAGLLMGVGGASAQKMVLEKPSGTIRVATFNADMNRKGAGVLIKDILERDDQIMNVAEIILRVRPDILLINEIDHDPEGMALARFVELLSEGVGGVEGLTYPHSFAGPSNTGVPSRVDLDGDGKTMGPGDALGFGRFPGQYAMALLSRFPIGEVRDFRGFPWAKVPWAEAPMNPDGTPYYAPEAWAALPLSSKSHWDAPVALPDGRVLHILASHPTPPVFDGPENRNGLRNAAEIRFWADYVDGADWMQDAAGQTGGLAPDAPFVIVGDLNADPAKGDGDRMTVSALINQSRVQDPRPDSPGAAAAGDADDTADWPEKNGPGNLRVDYVLPSTGLKVVGSAVFWPADDDPLHRLVQIRGRKRASSDHRLVWVDIGVNQE